MANKGDWVRVHNVVLKAEERTAKIPEDTQKCDLEMWVKGSLMEDCRRECFWKKALIIPIVTEPSYLKSLKLISS